MSLAISGSLSVLDTDAGADLGRPLFCYQNHFRDGDVTASTEQTDHPAEAAIDPFTATAWIGETGEGEWWIRVSKDGARADYAAITGWRGDYDERDPYSLAGVTVRLEASDDGGESWFTVGDPVLPDSRVVGWLFDSEQHDDWRFVFVADDPPEIVNVSLGEATVMDNGMSTGFEPPRQARNNEIQNNSTDQGHLVGRSVIRRGIETSLDISTVDEQWVRDVWEPLVDHLEMRGAYLVWNPIRWPGEIAYVWADGQIRPPRYSNAAGWMDVRLDVQGIT